MTGFLRTRFLGGRSIEGVQRGHRRGADHAGEEMAAFTRKMIALRQAFPVLRRGRFFTGDFNEEMGAAVYAGLSKADTLLLGRKTYDSFAGAWPARTVAVSSVNWRNVRNVSMSHGVCSMS